MRIGRRIERQVTVSIHMQVVTLSTTSPGRAKCKTIRCKENCARGSFPGRRGTARMEMNFEPGQLRQLL